MTDLTLPKGHYISAIRFKTQKEGKLLNHATVMYPGNESLYVSLSTDSGANIMQMGCNKKQAIQLSKNIIKTVQEQGDEVIAFETKHWETELNRVKGK